MLLQPIVIDGRAVYVVEADIEEPLACSIQTDAASGILWLVPIGKRAEGLRVLQRVALGDRASDRAPDKK
jgi:hypothetical protein